ncbi:MAG: hypothetical protein IBJ07_18910 [Rhizobiaceae bacterium]|nr:hypothetical protein [Rhizobiaceae bacterium]
MTDPSDIRRILLEAFRREGIDWPAERLEEAVSDCTDLHGFLATVREEARMQAARRHD